MPGGVARNIAEAASRLLAPSLPPPALLSVVGEDAAGQALLHNLATLRCAPTTCTHRSFHGEQ